MAHAVQFTSYLTDNQHIDIPMNIRNKVNAKRKVTVIIFRGRKSGACC